MTERWRHVDGPPDLPKGSTGRASTSCIAVGRQTSTKCQRASITEAPRIRQWLSHTGVATFTKFARSTRQRGQVYRVGRDGKYERLFADCDDASAVAVREIELAAGHMRVVDQCNGVAVRKGANDVVPVHNGARDNRDSARKREG